MSEQETLTGWVGDEDKCPECGTKTEYYDNGQEVLAERCSVCRWQIAFAHPSPHAVRFGTNPVA